MLENVKMNNFLTLPTADHTQKHIFETDNEINLLKPLYDASELGEYVLD